MKTIGQVVELLNTAVARAGADAPFLLYWEPGALEEGFEPSCVEGITDIRLVSDWPLPGESIVTHEGQHPLKVIAFYDNASSLDSST
jgi:hypothetical protein